jgi:acetyltransferase-like isoleucine patch superfamily enzyme
MLIDLFYKYFVCFFYKFQFGKFGNHSVILKPLKIQGKKNIFIGNNVVVQKYTWLAALPHTGSSSCRLIIEDGCAIGHFNHIYAINQINIEKNVLTADKVYISDNTHEYVNPFVPVLHQPVKQLDPVTIGEGSWLGENVCVLGASVGKHCVIGSNSVVTLSIPDYSIAVGIPAKVVKKFDFSTNKWIRVND